MWANSCQVELWGISLDGDGDGGMTLGAIVNKFASYGAFGGDE